MKCFFVLVLAGLASVFATTTVAADETPNHHRDVTFLAGLIQPVALSGWNVEFDARWGRLVAGYSHGWSLDIPVTGALDDQALSVHSPYSTGFGVGYELLDGLSLRLEPKIHRFEIDYADQGARSAKPIAEYRTITLGLGAYYVWRPLQAKRNWTRGLTVAVSLRYWPRVWSDLTGDEVMYDNAVTGATEVHETINIGVANTPFVGNVALGYTISL